VLAALVALVLAIAWVEGCAIPAGNLRIPETTPALTLPLESNSMRFAAIGDSGTGAAAQYRVAGWMAAARAAFPFELVLMMGDNLYGGENASAYEQKFARPYAPLLDDGVRFYASLGNHDETNQAFYEPFGMGGERYYTFKPQNDVRFFALDSTYLSPEQLEWLETELARSSSRWKIVFLHHPIYSSGGKHGSDVTLRKVLEPLFVAHGVDVVLQGHDHFYERLEPQQGIYYFVSGASAKLRRGDIDETAIHAAGFDQGFHFMLMEIVGEALHFQVISDQGRTVDSGVIQDRPQG
jgi:hypothetical protein